MFFYREFSPFGFKVIRDRLIIAILLNSFCLSWSYFVSFFAYSCMFHLFIYLFSQFVVICFNSFLFLCVTSQLFSQWFPWGYVKYLKFTTILNWYNLSSDIAFLPSLYIIIVHYIFLYLVYFNVDLQLYFMLKFHTRIKCNFLHQVYSNTGFCICIFTFARKIYIFISVQVAIQYPFIYT